MPYAKHKKLLIKYHGDFENHNIVLKEDDYLNFSQNHTLKEVFVKSLFSNKVILFVGYKVSDPNLRLLIKEIQYLLKKHHQRAYVLTTKDNVSDTEVKYFENLGINIVNYDTNSLKEIELKDTNLSDIGVKAYSLLKYIKDFKLYEYRNFLAKKSDRTKIINELYTSLDRFRYFRVLPQKTIAGLYPLCEGFNDTLNYFTGETTLKCLNHDLYEIIKDYKGISDDRYSKEEKEKLNYALSRIIHSGFYYLGKVDAHRAYGDYPVKEEDSIDLTIKINHKKCDCINCTLNEYDYASALKKISKYNITDKSELWDDLGYAHGLCRVYNFYNAYQAFKKIITKANRLNRFEVSFLAKYNLDKLKRAVRHDFFNHRIDEDDIKRINEEVDKINLDDELDKVKYFVDDDVYSFLKEIKDGVYVQRLCNEIDGAFVKVPKTVENIKNGGSGSSNVFFNLSLAARKLKYFLEGNFLLGNNFSPIQVALQKSINTFVWGYYLKDHELSERQKLFGVPSIQRFDAFLLTLIIEDANPKELSVFLRNNKINNIETNDKSQKHVIRWINNFFKSSYKIAGNFGNNLQKNEFYVSLTEHDKGFRNRIRHIFENICLVIAYFNFTESQLKNVYTNLNHFIDFMGFRRGEFKYLDVIYVKKYDLLNKEALIRTLDIFNNKGFINSTYILILEAIKKKDKNYINKNIKIENFNFAEYYNSQFPIIYESLPKDKRNDFREKLLTRLEDHKDPEAYFVTIMKKIMSSKKIKNQYKNIIRNKIQIKIDDTILEPKWFKLQLIQFFDLVNMGLIDAEGFEDIDIKEDFFLFLLAPENFDKARFQVKWLKELNWESYCKRFPKISYIIEALENSLQIEYDDDLGKVYFEIKKYV